MPFLTDLCEEGHCLGEKTSILSAKNQVSSGANGESGEQNLESSTFFIVDLFQDRNCNPMIHHLCLNNSSFKPWKKSLDLSK